MMKILKGNYKGKTTKKKRRLKKINRTRLRGCHEGGQCVVGIRGGKRGVAD